MNTRNTPQINAGSMADIAFLLLIFFLVTTTLDSEIGIQKMLSNKNTSIKPPINERNVLEIVINSSNEIQLEGSSIIQLENLKQFVVDFIDNGAKTDLNGSPCDWCNGKKDVMSSDHPSRAVVALESSRNTSYGTYIAAHNEINSAYTELRNKLAISLYGNSYEELLAAQKIDKKNNILAAQIDDVKKKYPVLIFDQEAIK